MGSDCAGRHTCDHPEGRLTLVGMLWQCPECRRWFETRDVHADGRLPEKILARLPEGTIAWVSLPDG